MIEIDSIKESNCTLIHVKGEVDASSSIELDNAIKQAAEAGKTILVDLQNLQYISSAGLGVFISYLDELKAQNIPLALYGLVPNVYEVFEILGLQHVIPIAKSKESALEMTQ